MDFIFMLTRQDQTVLDALDVMAEIRPLGLKHIGFKDVGVDKPTLRALNQAIKAAGAVSYMEVVSTSVEAALQSARVAAEIGIDRLLGGTTVTEILAVVKTSAIAYYPFPGKPVGHPTKLGGTAELVESQCRRFLDMGCAGVDLLAYRATEADPIDLVKAARRGLGKNGGLICAGSVDSPARMAELNAAGCDAFTIGSAAFDGSFSPRKGRLTSQLQDILAAC
jgi:2-keto-3-deoxy-6-phosphogluconate aldolase